MIVADTHALLWWSLSPEQLSPRAREAMDRGTAFFALISCMEIANLVRRGRVRLDFPVREWLDAVQALAHVRLLPMTREIAITAAELPDDIVRDPADRIIVATAMVHGLPLVTKDRKITAANLVETIW